MKTSQGMKDSLEAARDKAMAGDYQGYAAAIAGIFQYVWEGEDKADWVHRFNVAFGFGQLATDTVHSFHQTNLERLQAALSRRKNLNRYHQDSAEDFINKIQEGRKLNDNQLNLCDVIYDSAFRRGKFAQDFDHYAEQVA